MLGRSFLGSARKFDKPGRILPRDLAGFHSFVPFLPGHHAHLGVGGCQVRNRPITPPVLADNGDGVRRAAFGADEKKKYAEGSCCAKAEAKGEKCKHPCCVEAEKAGKVCEKCNK